MNDKLNQGQIHVALASDNNYFEGLLVTATSIAQTCSRPECLTFHLLDGGITQENYTYLNARLSSFGCQLSRISMNQDLELGKFKIYHGSKMTYARLLLPDLLPDVAHVIYSDVDILWHADIAELWDGLSTNAILHYVPPHPNSFSKLGSEESKWFTDNGFCVKPERYFCAGMIVMNLGKLRLENLSTKMVALLEEHYGQVPQNDQTVLNAFMGCRNDTKALDYKWQIGTGNTTIIPDDKSFVLHYAADTPWKTIHANHHMLTDAFLLWHKAHAQMRGISIWQSLRSCNSPIDIIAGRTLYLLASNFTIIRLLIRTYMVFSGKRDGIPCINAFMVKSMPLKELI